MKVSTTSTHFASICTLQKHRTQKYENYIWGSPLFCLPLLLSLHLLIHPFIFLFLLTYVSLSWGGGGPPSTPRLILIVINHCSISTCPATPCHSDLKTLLSKQWPQSPCHPFIQPMAALTLPWWLALVTATWSQSSYKGTLQTRADQPVHRPSSWGKKGCLSLIQSFPGCNTHVKQAEQRHGGDFPNKTNPYEDS